MEREEWKVAGGVKPLEIGYLLSWKCVCVCVCVCKCCRDKRFPELLCMCM
ncbi:hypothetical protein EXN66_Car011333 [Channa argus]|uniref:Uncharacterized protein n=1 Tax=Channa argus TaxID=215402 RepID=A0A6G1PZH9_CHAAH|nr:hypothetical protein EXN66_Car011333 [Channa argus]